MPRKKALDVITDVEADVLFEATPGQRSRAKRIDGKKLALPKGVRYWFTARSVAGDVDVVLGTERTIKDLVGNVAVIIPDLGIVAVDETQPLIRIVVAVIHELFGHAVWSAPSASEVNHLIFGCSPKRAEGIEERVASHAAPLWADCMIRSGLLRLPPIPRRRSRKGAKHGR